MSTNTIWAISAVGGAAAAITAMYQVFKPLHHKLKRFFDWVGRFMRDWEGEESEKGRDRVPGVMERLNKLDGELTNNGGKSTKDVVDKLLANQVEINKKTDHLLEAFVENSRRMLRLERHLGIDPEDDIRRVAS